MKTLHRYLVGQVLSALFLTVAVFAFVLLLGNVLNEIIALLLNRQASLALVGRAILYLLPYVLVFALPMAMLAATLLVFGRFSADQELTAVRAGGISLVSLVSPILLLAAALSVVCAVINLELAPRCRIAYKQLLASANLRRTSALLPEDRFIKDIPGYIIYLREREGNVIKDIHIYQLETNGVVLHATAERGEVVVDDKEKQIALVLFSAIVEKPFLTRPADEPEEEEILLPVPETPGANPAELDYSGFPVQEDELREPRVRKDRRTGVVWRSAFVGEWWTDPPLSLKQMADPEKKPKLSWMSFRQLQEEIEFLEAKGVDSTPAVVQMHRQVAFSFASFAFAMIGIPLGIRAHRRETTVGIALALVLVLIYYSFIVIGQSLDEHPEWRPHLVIWFPNFLFQGVGCWLLWRVSGVGR